MVTLSFLLAILSCTWVQVFTQGDDVTPEAAAPIVLKAAAAPGTGNCETIFGDKCIFPFRYRGKTFYSCTNDFTVNGKAWCAYDVRDDGNAVPGSWEDCDSSVCEVPDVCITESGPDRGNSCKFPFRFNGRMHHTCARWRWGGPNQGRYWCSTMTDRNDNHENGQGYYGFCDCNSRNCDCGRVFDNQPRFMASSVSESSIQADDNDGPQP